jgi:hypothetical protein
MQNLNKLFTKIYEYSHIESLHTCAHYAKWIVKNCPYCFATQIICDDLISVFTVNKLQ